MLPGQTSARSRARNARCCSLCPHGHGVLPPAAHAASHANTALDRRLDQKKKDSRPPFEGGLTGFTTLLTSRSAARKNAATPAQRRRAFWRSRTRGPLRARARQSSIISMNSMDHFL